MSAQKAGHEQQRPYKERVRADFKMLRAGALAGVQRDIAEMRLRSASITGNFEPRSHAELRAFAKIFGEEFAKGQNRGSAFAVLWDPGPPFVPDPNRSL